MSGLPVRSSGSSAAGPAHRPTRRGLRLVVFGGLIAAALALASCQPHGAALQGRITLTEGGHFAGIQVRVYSSTTESIVATTHTDRDGDYSFMPAMVAEGTYRILFSEDSWWHGATGWADATDVTVTAGSTRTIDATIDEATGSVAGMVTDGTDPLADVHVTARTMEFDQPIADTVTRADGTYRFAALPVGGYRFRFTLHGHTTRYSSSVAKLVDAPIITVGDGSTITGVDTTLIGEASISGIISDGSAPVEGGVVLITDLQNGLRRSLAVTSANGRFTFGELNAGQYAISWYDAPADEIAYYGWNGDGPQEPAAVTVPSGGTVDLGTLEWGTSFYPPTAPSAVTATAGAELAVVNWQPPAGIGGKAITGYTVTSDPGAKTCTTAGALRCGISGLTSGTTYTFTVTATNAIGDGPASASTAPVIPTTTAQWQQVMTPAYDAPSGRSMPAMAPLGDGRVVLYGGALDLEKPSGDTWVWSDDAWTQLHPTTAPDPLVRASMASLPGGGVMLFGGTSVSGGRPSNETWIFDGMYWNRPDLTTAPSPRSAAAMTTLSNGDVLLFGGLGGDSAPLDDTWIFDGFTWTELDPGTSPPARMDSTIATLPGGEAVLFGGTSDGTTVMDDTWVFDGTTWHDVDPTTAPPGRIGAAMVALGDGGVVLFGGGDFGSLTSFDDTWTFDGTDWTAQDPSTVPPARYGAAAATTSDGEALVFGGLDLANISEGDDGNVPNDTWVFDG
ncbi:MAG TPA: carboxypeptidase regulatory-like domain-containing protein, partial [Acidimicrobiales bacterium]|nr:carboxypeptidase regulatory-like domain-containing protein [Acidimicrobiales bacterium]